MVWDRNPNSDPINAVSTWKRQQKLKEYQSDNSGIAKNVDDDRNTYFRKAIIIFVKHYLNIFC